MMKTKQFKRPDLENDTNRIQGVYMPSLLTMKVALKITEIGENLKEILENKIVQKIEGKCISEGFIRPKSVRILEYSSGNIVSENIEFNVSYECMVCHPVENMKVHCEVHRITQAGIHAQVVIDGIVPLTVFVARDHNYVNKLFSQIKENQTINVRIIGIQYELNDPFITSIGTIVDMGRDTRAGDKKKDKPKIHMEEDEDIDVEAENLEEEE